MTPWEALFEAARLADEACEVRDNGHLMGVMIIVRPTEIEVRGQRRVAKIAPTIERSRVTHRDQVERCPRGLIDEVRLMAWWAQDVPAAPRT